MANVTIALLGVFATNFAKKAATVFAKKEDIPDSLPADGGNAATVNGYTVGTDVPEGAKFSDTTYQEATASSSGLMSAEDKTKLDEMVEGTEEDIDRIIADAFKE